MAFSNWRGTVGIVIPTKGSVLKSGMSHPCLSRSVPKRQGFSHYSALIVFAKVS